MRSEHQYPYHAPDRSTSDSAMSDSARHRGEAWQPGNPDRRRSGRYAGSADNGGNGERGFPERRRMQHDDQYAGNRGKRGPIGAQGDQGDQDDQYGDSNAGAARRITGNSDFYRDSRGNPYGQDSGYVGMDWSRSGSVRQGYGDYGNARDAERNARAAYERNAGNEPHPYSVYQRPAFHRAEAPRKPRPPKGYVRSDERIREDVCEHLMADPWIDAGDVSVTVKDGVVVLEGSVSARNMRYALETTAASCIGVKDVENKVRVQMSGDHGQAEQAGHARSQQPQQQHDSSISPSAQGPGMENSSVSDTHPLGGDQGRFYQPNTE